MNEFSEEYKQRFFNKIKKEDSGCWLWTGSRVKNRNGLKTYGIVAHPKCTFKNRRSNLVAHRVSWMIHNGAIPEGMDVCHHCDNPPCCNPAHLFTGTRKENMADCAKKGRLNSPKGEDQCKAVLTEKDVERMRTMYASERITMAKIGRLFGVDKNTARYAITGAGWKHVKTPPVQSKPIYGENGASAKLTNEMVVKIKADLAEGIKTQKQIGEQFGVSQSSVSLIKYGGCWSHVT